MLLWCFKYDKLCSVRWTNSASMQVVTSGVSKHCPAEFSSNLPQHTYLEVSSMHRKTLISCFRSFLLRFGLNSSGQWPSKSRIGYPWITSWPYNREMLRRKVASSLNAWNHMQIYWLGNTFAGSLCVMAILRKTRWTWRALLTISACWKKIQATTNVFIIYL